MVRRARVEIEGGLYHVDNRVASGEPVFSDPEETVEFVELIQETRSGDGWTVLAWCVMSNHCHLVIRTGGADVVSWWAGEGAKSRVTEPGYAEELDRLDRGVAARAAELGAEGRLR